MGEELSAQVRVESDTVRGNLGETICLPITIEADESSSFTMKGKIILENPTLFYPEEFTSNHDIEYNFERSNDTLCYFTLYFSGSQGEKVTINLCGEALAGNDSICYVEFRDVRLNNEEISSFRGKIIAKNTGVDLFYIRFMNMKHPCPNPAARGQEIVFQYRIDKETYIKVFIYDIAGNLLHFEIFNDVPPGWHDYKFVPDHRLSSGCYWIMIRSNFGGGKKKFMIVK